MLEFQHTTRPQADRSCCSKVVAVVVLSECLERESWEWRWLHPVVMAIWEYNEGMQHEVEMRGKESLGGGEAWEHQPLAELQSGIIKQEKES